LYLHAVLCARDSYLEAQVIGDNWIDRTDDN
jgi:hypothetical protein